MEEFDVKKFPFELFLQMMPFLKPRLYSIASSPQLSRNEVQIFVSGVNVNRKNGELSYAGVCSRYLSTATENIQCFISPSVFQLPDHFSKNICCFCSGTGISFFYGCALERRSCLQMQIKNASDLSKFEVYFGCRDETHFIEKETLEKMRDEGAITMLRPVYSKIENKHITDILQYDDVFQKIQDEFYFLICGSKELVRSVKTFFLDLFIAKLNLTSENAEKEIVKLKNAGRIIEDIQY